jgi:hypothetical protein
VDQHATDAHQVLEADGLSVWRSHPDSGDGEYLAVFKLRQEPRTIDLPWGELGLTAADYELRDLWSLQDFGATARFRVHGAAVDPVFAQ